MITVQNDWIERVSKSDLCSETLAYQLYTACMMCLVCDPVITWLVNSYHAHRSVYQLEGRRDQDEKHDDKRTVEVEIF